MKIAKIPYPGTPHLLYLFCLLNGYASTYFQFCELKVYESNDYIPQPPSVGNRLCIPTKYSLRGSITPRRTNTCVLDEQRGVFCAFKFKALFVFVLPFFFDQKTCSFFFSHPLASYVCQSEMPSSITSPPSFPPFNPYCSAKTARPKFNSIPTRQNTTPYTQHTPLSPPPPTQL